MLATPPSPAQPEGSIDMSRIAFSATGIGQPTKAAKRGNLHTFRHLMRVGQRACEPWQRTPSEYQRPGTSAEGRSAASDSRRLVEAHSAGQHPALAFRDLSGDGGPRSALLHVPSVRLELDRAQMEPRNMPVQHFVSRRRLLSRLSGDAVQSETDRPCPIEAPLAGHSNALTDIPR